MAHVLVHTLYLISRAVSFLVALVFSYMALFMYEGQGGKLQNRLVDMWVGAGLAYQGVLNKQLRFIQKSAAITDSALSWLFGTKPVSVQVVVISFCLSIASLGLLPRLISLFYPPANAEQQYENDLLLNIGTVYLIYSLFASGVLFKKRRWFLSVIALLLLAIVTTSSALYIGVMNFGFEFPASMWLPFGLKVLLVGSGSGVVGLICNFVFLSCSRLFTRFMADAAPPKVLIIGLASSLLWLILLVEGSRYIGFSATDPAAIRDPVLKFLVWVLGPQDQSDALRLIFYFGINTNLFNFVAAFGVILVMFGVVMHRVFWPVAREIIYALYKWRILSDKKVQLAAAIAFMTYAFPWFGTFLKAFGGH